MDLHTDLSGYSLLSSSYSTLVLRDCYISTQDQRLGKEQHQMDVKIARLQSRGKVPLVVIYFPMKLSSRS